MSAAPGAMRPDDGDAYRQALRAVRERTGVPLAFGGRLSGKHFVLEDFVGNRTDSLRGVHVVPGHGLGGYVVDTQKPFAVNDYAVETAITHDYDREVLGEGIRAVAASPVTVRGQVRGVIYAAVRSVFPIGDTGLAAMHGVARKLAMEIAIRDEVDRRVKVMETAALVPAPQAGLTAVDLRDLRTELLDIAMEMEDGALRDRLRQACERIPGQRAPRGPVSPLSPRERDVLAQVSLGCSNAEAADRLGLRAETVKAYLRSASQKLGTSGRYQTVLAARAHGLVG